MAVVGNLVAHLRLNTAAFTSGFMKARKDMKQMGVAMNRMGTDLTQTVTLPLVAAGAAVVKFGANFDKAITESTAIMGNLSDTMKNDMVDAAKEVAKTSTYSATEAGKAYYYLASAGLDAAASIKALPGVAKFAQAGVFDLSTATDLLTDAQSALGLTIKDNAEKNYANMIRVSDALVKANTLANSSVQQFSEALTNDAAVAARQVGMEVEETIAVLAVFADQGIKGADAGTKFAIVMRDLQTAALKQPEAFRNFGVAVYDASGEMRKMTDIIADLEKALAGKTDAEKKAILSMMGFKDKSVKAMLTLVGFSDAIEDYESKLLDAGGTTEKVAKTQLTSFSNMIQLMGNRLQVSAIDMFEALKPTLENVVLPLFDKLINIVEGIVDAFVALPTPIQTAIVALAGVTAALGPLMWGGSKIMFTLSNMASLFSAIGPSIGKFSGAIQAAGGVLPLFGLKLAAAKTALLGLFTSLKVLMPVLMGPWGIALAAAAAAVIYFRDDIAAAIVTVLDFFGIVEDHTREYEDAVKSADATTRKWASRLGLTAQEFKGLNEDIGKTTSVLSGHGDEVRKLKKQYADGKITQDQYIASLKGIIDGTSTNTDRTKDLKKELERLLGGTGGNLNDLIKGQDEAARKAKEHAEKLRRLNEEIDLFILMTNSARAAAGSFDTALAQATMLAETAARQSIPDLSVSIEGMTSDLFSSEYMTENWGKGLQAAAAHVQALGIDIDEKLKKKLKEFGKEQKKSSTITSQWKDSLTTAFGNITSSFTQNLNNMIFKGQKFSMDLKSIFMELGQSLLQILTSTFFNKIGGLFTSLFDKILGGAAAEGAAGGGLGGLGKLFSAIPGWGWLAGGAAAGAFGLYKLFKKTPIGSGSKEIKRDFGVDIGKDALGSFLGGVGISESQFEGYRKDILSSPAAFAALLLPQAQATGQVDQLIARFSNLAAFGRTYDLSAEVTKAIAGDYSDFNKRFQEIFGGSIPQWTELLQVPVQQMADTLDDASQDLEESASTTADNISQAQTSTTVNIESRPTIQITITSPSEDMKRTVRTVLIPALQDELDKNNSGLASSVVRAVNSNKRGVVSRYEGNR